MTANKCITRLLRMQGFCVTSFKIADDNSGLHLCVKPKKTGCCCPECKRRCRIVHQTLEYRQWRDVVVCGMPVYFYYRPKEIDCPTHGRIQEDLPWADRYARVTYRFEFLLLVYCQIMSQKAATRVLHVCRSTLSDILHRTINRIRSGHRLQDIAVIGIDEISYCKGKKYATVVYDLKRSCVVWVGKGKGRETIDIFFQEVLSQEQRERITWACCDISKAYLGALEDYCPGAIIVIDHFHIVKALNEAVDEVRKEEWRKADKDERKVLRGLRFLLFRHSSNRSKKDTRILNGIRKSNNRIYRAWVLKDEFEHFWPYVYPHAAEKFIKGWITAALRSRLEPLREFAFMLRRHLDKILAFIGTRITNAIAEGINRIIRMVKNRASGYRTLAAFTDMIFLTVGDVDIPAQIPEHFRTV